MNNIKPLIVANWKMNPQTIKEAKLLFNFVKKGVKNIKKAEVVICPPFVYLPILQAEGAQDCFWEKKGAYTGEISSFMLKDLGCQYVIVGHSERRHYFEETDQIVNKKIKAVIEARMTPILCIGESKEQRDKEETKMVLEKELTLDLEKIPISSVVIAYEPIWAIGSGKPCDIEEAQKMGLLIRKIISKNVRILYGGSVNSKNAGGYIKEAGLGGLLVGNASLDAKEFIKIIKSVI